MKLSTGSGLAITSNTTGYTGKLASIVLGDDVGNINTASLLSLNSSGPNSTAKALNVNVASVGNLGNAVGSGGVNFTFAAHTGNGVQIDDATLTGNAMAINANSITSGNGLTISANNLTSGNGLLVIKFRLATKNFIISIGVERIIPQPCKHCATKLGRIFLLRL